MTDPIPTCSFCGAAHNNDQCLSREIRYVVSQAVAMASKRHEELQAQRQQTKAWWLGYYSVEQMEDHLPWLETRWPEGAEI